MPSETEIIIAFLFNRSGKTKLSFSDFYLTLSMELKWFSPEDAKAFINSAIKQDLLTKKDENIQPNFDFSKIVVPVGFAPSKKIIEPKKVEILKEEKEDILDKIIKQIIKKADIDKKQIFEKINTVAKEKNITIEVAALLVGKEYDIQLDTFFEETENKIFL